jgi:hypothetical protein
VAGPDAQPKVTSGPTCMHLAVLRIDSDQYGPSRTLDCVSAPLVDKMLLCLPRMGFPDAERQSILSFRDIGPRGSCSYTILTHIG